MDFILDEGDSRGNSDKRDKGKSQPHLPFLLIRIHATVLAFIMDVVPFYFFLFCCFVTFSGASEYKLCATADREHLCKWIEASRNEITCVKVSDSVDCLLKMQNGEADFGVFYLEEAFLAERFLGNNAVVLAEVRHPDRPDDPFNFQTVAVVRNTMFGGLSGLKGLNYCHPGFSKAEYWSDRVLKEFETKVLEHFKDDLKCNSALRSAYEDDLYRLTMVFNKACRPGTWAVGDWWDKMLKRDYHTLCDQCDRPSTCSYEVRNKGRHSNALRCLTLGGGNVTYTALEFVREYFELDSEEYIEHPQHKLPSRYNFLCPDGSTVPLTNQTPCSWMKQPWTPVIASNSTSQEILRNLKEWLTEGINLTWTSHLRNILTKGNGVLKFRERPTPVAQYIREGREIPSADENSCRNAVRWCTIGKSEKQKCEYISTAALTHGLPNRVRCVEGTSKIDCLSKVRSKEADVVYIDSELGFISRNLYNLTAASYLETQRVGNYYGVLVVKGDTIKKLKDLQGKRACFPRYNGLGWLTFIETLKSLSVLPRRSCSNSKKAWNYFTQACAPGAKDPKVNTWAAMNPERLCKGCGNGGTCEASSQNPYFGEVGALRCLNNGDGDVAFLDYHAIQKYLTGKETSPDLSVNLENLKILCRDGSVEKFSAISPDKCSFIQINGGEVVTRNDLETVQKTDISHTLMELDDLFGTTSRSYNPALKMFEPFGGQTDVLFKDSAVSLVNIYETQNRFVNNYIKLLEGTENCYNYGSFTRMPSVFAVVFSVFLIFFH